MHVASDIVEMLAEGGPVSVAVGAVLYMLLHAHLRRIGKRVSRVEKSASAHNGEAIARYKSLRRGLVAVMKRLSKRIDDSVEKNTDDIHDLQLENAKSEGEVRSIMTMINMRREGIEPASSGAAVPSEVGGDHTEPLSMRVKAPG